VGTFSWETRSDKVNMVGLWEGGGENGQSVPTKKRRAQGKRGSNDRQIGEKKVFGTLTDVGRRDL